MTQRKALFSIGAMLIAALFSSHALAVNELFMARGPLGHLKKEDVEIARGVIRKTLDTGPDGQVQTWANPKTKASGTVKPTKTFTKDNMRCRAVDFTTSAGGERAASTWSLCSTKDGWRIVQ